MPDSIPASWSSPSASAFEQIYNCYWKKMYNLAFQYTHDSELAKEIVQHIFESLWERWDDFIIHEWLENYLLKAVKLQIAAHYRQQATRQKHLDTLMQHQEPLELTTENQVLMNELTQRVRQLVDQLPLQRRRVFELSRLRGLTNREIAAELSLAEKTVENHLTYALHFLRNNLADCFQTR